MKLSLLLLFSGFLAAIQIVSAGNNGGPFEVIARENAFRLRPPTPEAPPVSRPQITLQGFTTLLGRAQVLLNILPAPGTASISCIMSENQNQDGVTILEINLKSETVRFNNLGLDQMLALKR